MFPYQVPFWGAVFFSKRTSPICWFLMDLGFAEAVGDQATQEIARDQATKAGSFRDSIDGPSPSKSCNMSGGGGKDSNALFMDCPSFACFLVPRCKFFASAFGNASGRRVHRPQGGPAHQGGEPAEIGRRRKSKAGWLP